MSTRATRIPSAFSLTTAALQRSMAGLDPVRIVLPWPPTLNHLRMPVRGRLIVSPEYRDWMDYAGVVLIQQRPKKVLGKVGITVEVAPADKRRRDLDNFANFKAVLDLLVKHGIIEGDDSRTVRSLHAHWDDVSTDKRLVVTIKPAVF